MAQNRSTLSCDEASMTASEANRAHLSSSIRSSAELNTESDIVSESRLASLIDSIVLKKQKKSNESELGDVEMTETSSSKCAVFASNDSLELYPHWTGERRCGQKRSLNDTEDLLGNNLRVRFASQSPQPISIADFTSTEPTAKLTRWPGMSNLHSNVEVSDSQFMSSLIPLLHQVPTERKASVRDELCRVLLQGMPFTGCTKTALPSPPAESPAWPHEELFIGTEALMQAFMLEARDLIASREGHTQSTPIPGTSLCRSSGLEAHFPLTDSLHWSVTEECEL